LDCSSLDVFRFAPLADRSALDAWPSMPVYGSLRTLTFCGYSTTYNTMFYGQVVYKGF
jgi:hypothetical protein